MAEPKIITGMYKMKLLKALHSEGQYEGFTPEDGFIYLLSLGYVDRREVFMKLAIKGGTLKMLSQTITKPLQNII